MGMGMNVNTIQTYRFWYIVIMYKQYQYILLAGFILFMLGVIESREVHMIQNSKCHLYNRTSLLFG